MTTILVGVDGSQAADTALQWALTEAGRWGAPGEVDAAALFTLSASSCPKCRPPVRRALAR